jgi:hypothetical protein
MGNAPSVVRMTHVLLDDPRPACPVWVARPKRCVWVSALLITTKLYHWLQDPGDRGILNGKSHFGTLLEFNLTIFPPCIQ